MYTFSTPGLDPLAEFFHSPTKLLDSLTKPLDSMTKLFHSLSKPFHSPTKLFESRSTPFDSLTKLFHSLTKCFDYLAKSITAPIGRLSRFTRSIVGARTAEYLRAGNTGSRMACRSA